MAIVKRKKTETLDTDERNVARDLAGLLLQLKDTAVDVRRWAARDLSQHPEAITELIAALSKEPDAGVREAILLALTEIGSAEAVQGLVQCLRSEDASLRNEAIDAMRNLPEAVAPIMAGLLLDKEPDVRIFAVNVLESLRHPHVEQWLLDVISKDEHVNVCATAVDLLGEVGTVAAVSSLEALKKRFPEEPYIEFAADLALRRIREV
jgi:HEAT repeat protein